MDIISKTVVLLVLAGIKKRPLDYSIEIDIDFTDVIDEAKKHKIESLIYYPLSENREMLRISKNLLDELRVIALYEGARQEQGYVVLSQILGKMTAKNVKVVVLKGVFLRHLYPQPELRLMSDYDILLKPCDIEKADKVLKDYGYERNSDSDKHVSYLHKNLPGIELHRHLVKQGLLVYNEAFESSVWERTVPYYINGVQTYTLCPQDHLIHMFMHMGSHMLRGGFGLRQLCDLTLFTEAYNDVIDWHELLKMADLLHIRTFAVALFKICNELFELKIPDVFILPCKTNILHDLTDSIFDSGVYGKPDTDHIAANMYLYFAGASKNGGNWYKLHDFFAMMFPGVDKLAPKYQYAQKYRFLLPAAWLHRIAYCIVRKDVSLSVKTAVFTSSKPGEMLSSKRALLKKLDLVD
jgi:hypothetical protein